MEGNRPGSSFRPHANSQSFTPYSKKLTNSPYMFARRTPEERRRRVHNPNDSPNLKRVLMSVENNYSPTKDWNVAEEWESVSMNYYSVPMMSTLSLMDGNHEDPRKRTSTTQRPFENKMSKQFDSKVKSLFDFQSKRREASTRIFTGTVEKVLSWYKLKNFLHVLVEVIAVLVDVRQGSIPSEKQLVLRDEKSGPALSVVYYEMDVPMPQLRVGSIVKCIGAFKSRTVVQAFKLEESSEDERVLAQRLFMISGKAAEEAMSYFIKNK